MAVPLILHALVTTASTGEKSARKLIEYLHEEKISFSFFLILLTLARDFLNWPVLTVNDLAGFPQLWLNEVQDSQPSMLINLPHQ